jgi:DnaJ domain
MQFLLLGLALLVLVLLSGRAFARANPKLLASNMRKLGGVGAIIAALLLIVTGKLMLGLPLALFGYSLLSRTFSWSNPLGAGSKSAGQTSSVRTEMLEMTLDHDSGAMDGMIRRGRFAGRRLSDLSGAELEMVLAEARQRDVQAAQLLEAFLQRRQQNRNGGAGQSAGAGATTSRAMTVDEAYAVLGLPPGASREQVQTAHRSLMKKYHPDQGGTTYLASKINEAKDLLLKHLT